MQCFPDHLLGDHLYLFSMKALKLFLFPLISSHILLLQFIVSTKQCISNIFPFSIAVRHVRKVVCYIWLLGSYSFLPFSTACVLKIKQSIFHCYHINLFPVSSKEWSMSSHSIFSSFALCTFRVLLFPSLYLHFTSSGGENFKVYP